MMIMIILIISHNYNNVNVVINRALRLKHLREAYRKRTENHQGLEGLGQGGRRDGGGEGRGEENRFARLSPFH